MSESNQDHLDSEVIVTLLEAVRTAADDELRGALDSRGTGMVGWGRAGASRPYV